MSLLQDLTAGRARPETARGPSVLVALGSDPIEQLFWTSDLSLLYAGAGKAFHVVQMHYGNEGSVKADVYSLAALCVRGAE